MGVWHGSFQGLDPIPTKLKIPVPIFNFQGNFGHGSSQICTEWGQYGAPNRLLRLYAKLMQKKILGNAYPGVSPFSLTDLKHGLLIDLVAIYLIYIQVRIYAVLLGL